MKQWSDKKERQRIHMFFLTCFDGHRAIFSLLFVQVGSVLLVEIAEDCEESFK